MLPIHKPSAKTQTDGTKSMTFNLFQNRKHRLPGHARAFGRR